MSHYYSNKFGYHILVTFKVLFPIHSLNPDFFSNIMEILVPEVESYLEDFILCEVSCTNWFKSSPGLGETCEKNRLGN